MAIVIEGDVVTMSLEEYEQLESDSRFLNCLEMQGVDNWDGYEFAQDMFRDEE